MTPAHDGPATTAAAAHAQSKRLIKGTDRNVGIWPFLSCRREPQRRHEDLLRFRPLARYLRPQFAVAILKLRVTVPAKSSKLKPQKTHPDQVLPFGLLRG